MQLKTTKIAGNGKPLGSKELDACANVIFLFAGAGRALDGVPYADEIKRAIKRRRLDLKKDILCIDLPNAKGTRLSAYVDDAQAENFARLTRARKAVAQQRA